jgi:hypothetical protein
VEGREADLPIDLIAACPESTRSEQGGYDDSNDDVRHIHLSGESIRLRESKTVYELVNESEKLPPSRDRGPRK